MLVGCCRTPVRYSQYCELHLNENKEAADCIKKVPGRKVFNHSGFSLFKTRSRKKQRGFGATSCRTVKARSDAYIRKCARSFGVIAAVTNCGVVTTFGEIFRTETLKEILQLLTNSIKVSGVIPKTAAYDDGCHLVEYLHKHLGKDLNSTAAANSLAQVKFSVDRTHFRNHVGTWCRANMNPNDNPLLTNVNTQTTEQIFSWLKDYAAIISSLGWKRASVFLLLIFHHKNLITTHAKCTSVFDIPHEIPHIPDISLMHLADEMLTSNYTTNSSKNVTSRKQSIASVLENSTTTILTKKRKTVTLQNDSQQQQKQATGVYSKTDWSAQVERIIKQSSSIKENF
ncbi:unnamed protein product [Rotaria socialis]|uniref:Uncharacterized protein n=1 Tax=Rotaria socialis TaxID=392032 RepID=A0A820ZMN2_9BILA|nr:unnamed protein product [Rotaria socialis]